jgi:3-oxoacyl-[acyl-carrier protein] reductase
VLLKGKNAAIYGAGGAIGGAVARAFAREGATVYLAGRTLTSLERVAEHIRSTGGAAETAQVDALGETAVDAHADDVAARAGGSTSPSSSSPTATSREPRSPRCRWTTSNGRSRPPCG